MDIKKKNSHIFFFDFEMDDFTYYAGSPVNEKEEDFKLYSYQFFIREYPENHPDFWDEKEIGEKIKNVSLKSCR